MRTQLQRLLAYQSSSQVAVRVLPFSAGAHAGLNGSLNLLSFGEGPDVAYSEGYGSGRILTDSREIRLCSVQYDLLLAAAPSPDDSADLIAQVMEDPDEQHR
jgi:hypothetical protein